MESLALAAKPLVLTSMGIGSLWPASMIALAVIGFVQVGSSVGHGPVYVLIASVVMSPVLLLLGSVVAASGLMLGRRLLAGER